MEWVFGGAGYDKQGVLLFPQSNFSYWIPAEAFGSVEEFSRFVELVKLKVPKTKEIR